MFISGGAPLGMDSAGWFADVGIRIFEGYGLTETSPVIALNFPDAHRMGTVGKALHECGVPVCRGWRTGGEGAFDLQGVLEEGEGDGGGVYCGWMVQDGGYWAYR